MAEIVHPLFEYELTLDLTLRGELARSVLEIAERRKQEPVDMIADVIQAVFTDDIIDAVIDD